MGKGDTRTRRGKIVRGSYGVRRLKKKAKKFAPVAKKAANTSTSKPK
jgi:ribosomal small subunit protein bTHX